MGLITIFGVQRWISTRLPRLSLLVVQPPLAIVALGFLSEVSINLTLFGSLIQLSQFTVWGQPLSLIHFCHLSPSDQCTMTIPFCCSEQRSCDSSYLSCRQPQIFPQRSQEKSLMGCLFRLGLRLNFSPQSRQAYSFIFLSLWHWRWAEWTEWGLNSLLHWIQLYWFSPWVPFHRMCSEMSLSPPWVYSSCDFPMLTL